LRDRSVRPQLSTALGRPIPDDFGTITIFEKQQLSTVPASPRTVAVMPLRFVGPDSTLQPLERGFAELITIDLSRSHLLTVVERARIQALLDELSLQQSGQTDANTNVRAGKIIQAGRIVSGQIAQVARGLRVDAAILNTQTSSVTGGAAVTEGEAGAGTGGSTAPPGRLLAAPLPKWQVVAGRRTRTDWHHTRVVVKEDESRSPHPPFPRRFSGNHRQKGRTRSDALGPFAEPPISGIVAGYRCSSGDRAGSSGRARPVLSLALEPGSLSSVDRDAARGIRLPDVAVYHDGAP